jgi:hypothetical protein
LGPGHLGNYFLLLYGSWPYSKNIEKPTLFPNNYVLLCKTTTLGGNTGDVC